MGLGYSSLLFQRLMVFLGQRAIADTDVKQEIVFLHMKTKAQEYVCRVRDIIFLCL